MKNLITLSLIVVAAAANAQYWSNTIEASNNATIQGAGPRSGSSGKAFFNMEGSNNGSFASYGVADFDGTLLSFSNAVSAITKVTVTLTESDAAFTAPGDIRLFLSGDTSTDIEPGTSPLKYDAASAPNGIPSTDLNPKYLLGTGAFTSTGNTNTGQVDVYTFDVSDAASDLLLAAVGTGDIRLLVAPDTAGGAATFAGYSHSTLTGPQIQLQGVPEPTTLSLAGLAAIAALRRRRAK